MKKLQLPTLFFVTAILVISNLHAQRERMLDGMIWNGMKTENKMYYVTGFLNGLEKAENILEIHIRNQQQREFIFTEPFYLKRSREVIGEYIPRGENRINLVVGLVDAFYSDPNNQKIPFTAAVRIALARNAGDIERSELWLREARREITLQGRK